MADSNAYVIAGTVEQPRYFRVAEADCGATQKWMIVCDEGWRQSIVCTDMYEWAADWLLGVIGQQPFAPELRP
jgi:hypothetical protein